ncbi:hypothetical protein B7494_g8609 [Chlorociboria aeruginascens]|nr:hypothetical protein B7494_g8609 [Chlorociboria aeruginascens]
MEAMTSQAAPLPDFQEACEYTWLKSDNLLIEEAPIPESGDPYKYQPHQVLSQSIEVWQADIAKFFPGVFTIHQFYGTENTITIPARLRTLVQPSTVERLNDILTALDPHDPQTGLTICLTAHSTWYSRTLGIVENAMTIPFDDQPGLDSSEHGTDADCSGSAVEETPATKTLTGKVYTSRCAYTWARIIVDEAHHLRNPDTLLAESIFQATKKNIHFLSATPMLNHARDLRGFLYQLFQPKWALVNVPLGLPEAYEEDFDPKNAVIEGESSNVFPKDPGQEFLTAYEKGTKLYLLDPKQYSATGRHNLWSSYVCQLMMPPILHMILLRIGYETELTLEDRQVHRVGETVPRCDLYAIQLEMGQREKKEHDGRTLHMLGRMGMGETSQDAVRIANTSASQALGIESETLVNSAIYRYIKHATLDPRMALMTELNHSNMTKEQKLQASKTRVNNWTGVDLDHGASYFFTRTRAGPEYGIPLDRVTMARYLASYSVKTRFALQIIAENIEKKEKTILVFEFPMCLWMVETQLANLGIKQVALRSNQTQEDRTAIIKAFNSTSSDIWVLLLTTALGSTSLNLQESASCMVVMEIPISFYILTQVLGRVNRIGQKKVQRVYLLWIDQSYDQIALHRIFRKIIPSLCGEGHAAKAEDPPQVAQSLMQIFLGLKGSHTPLAPEWGKAPYHMKDTLSASLEESGPADQATGSSSGPVHRTPRKMKHQVGLAAGTRPTQNIVSPAAKGVIMPVVSRKRKTPGPDTREDAMDPAVLEELLLLEELRTKRQGLKGVVLNQATKKYRKEFSRLQSLGHLSKELLVDTKRAGLPSDAHAITPNAPASASDKPIEPRTKKVLRSSEKLALSEERVTNSNSDSDLSDPPPTPE